MKRTFLVMLAVLALASGCGSPLPIPLPAPGGSTALSPLRGGTPLAVGSITPATAPVSDFASLIPHLTAAGATVEQTGATANSVFKGTGHVIKVNGSEVQAFEYANAAAADADAARISSDGSKVGNSAVDWVAAPHFYRAGKLLVVYAGSDLRVINPLEFVLGRQFAGAPIRVAAGPVTATTPAPAAAPTTKPATTAAAATANCTDRAVMVQDMSIPDKTVMKPTQGLPKTWRLRNTGTCTWSTAYSLAFAKGTNMGPASDTALPASVAPGATVDLTIPITAPANAGTYRGNYQLRNAAGNLFPVTNSSDGTFWVLIVVSGSGPAATLTPVPTAGTPRIAFPTGSTGVTFNVNPPAGGAVPYLLTATAGQELHIGSSGPGLVLVLTSPGGAQLSPSSVDAQGLSVFALPQTGDYTLTFSGSANQVTIVMPAAH